MAGVKKRLDGIVQLTSAQTLGTVAPEQDATDSIGSRLTDKRMHIFLPPWMHPTLLELLRKK